MALRPMVFRSKIVHFSFVYSIVYVNGHTDYVNGHTDYVNGHTDVCINVNGHNEILGPNSKM